MSRHTSVLFLALLLASSRTAAGNGQPDPGQTLKGLSIEDLSKIDVTSVSKHAESIAGAAAAISVITAEDLRRSGVTELAEALRLAVGVSVARFNGESWGVSARGFNISTANKMLVLVDGRSVYTPLFSGVFWGAQDVVLEDVERIEIVRGPGGTLWGANAVNGVINIITKVAGETQGALAMTAGGSRVGQQVVRYGDKLGEHAAYRAYAKYSYFGAQVFSTGVTAHDPLRHGQAGFRMDWTPPSRTTVTLQGDGYTAHSGLSDRPDIEESGANLLGRLLHTSASGSQLQIQAYYDGTYRNVPRQFSEHRDTYDADFQYRTLASSRHDMTIGLGYRLTAGRAPRSAVLFFDPESRSSHLLNAFVQDEITIVPDTLVATIGSKVEHNDFTGVEYQPTARLRWSSRRQSVWGAVSRAVRMPTRFDSDLQFTGPSPVVVLRGNPDFKSETVVALESGYRLHAAGKLSIDIAGFVNGYDDLRTQEPSTAPGGIPVTLANNLEATTRGFELGLDYLALSRWQLHAAYTRFHGTFRLDPESHDLSGGTGEHNDPANQFSLRSYVDLPASAELDVVYRFVGALPQPAVKGYSELTIRGGWGHGGPIELSLIGENLLHRRHGEAPATGTLQEQYLTPGDGPDDVALLNIFASVVVMAFLNQAVPVAAPAGTTLEYEVKAAYILNFINFIEWPATAIGATDPFRICIEGRDPFGGTLDKMAQGETVRGRPIVVERLSETSSSPCHVLFYSGTNASGFIASLRASQSAPVLTIGESDAFLRSGGVMSFSIDQGHVRFDVDRGNAERQGLILSSRLLRVARSVR